MNLVIVVAFFILATAFEFRNGKKETKITVIYTICLLVSLTIITLRVFDVPIPSPTTAIMQAAKALSLS